MLIFYPRDIGIWRKLFTFNSSNPTPSISFNNLTELKQCYLSQGGIPDRENDEFKFEVIGPDCHPVFGQQTYTVRKRLVLGWLHYTNQTESI